MVYVGLLTAALTSVAHGQELETKYSGAEQEAALGNETASESKAQSDDEPLPEGAAATELLDVFADAAERQRYVESGGGLLSAGFLFGMGFATERQDMTLSHWLWGSSGFVALASGLNLAIKSDVELLRAEAPSLQEDELRERWRRLARRLETERKTGAVLGALIGTGSTVVGGLVLSGDVGALPSDDRILLGAGLMAGGVAIFGDGLLNWFVKTPTERGYQVLELSAPRPVEVSLTPNPGGAMLQLHGAF